MIIPDISVGDVGRLIKRFERTRRMKKTITTAIFLILLLALNFSVFASGDAESSTSDEKVSIEIMMHPWVATPPGPVDPYKAWLDEALDADINLTTSTEFNTEILTRFAADSPPDVIEAGYLTLVTLYDQGVLVQDWNPYLDKMPTVSAGMGDPAKLFYTRDEKLITLTNPPGGQLWTWNIRKDWLAALGLSMPTTPDELLEVARAFTTDDPDGNGVDDTYGLSSAGGGSSLGEITNLKLMYGPTSFYIADDGSVKHPVTDGNEKLFLDFLKKVVDEELIDPDWYSQGWNDRKPNLFKGMFGISWYPPMALLSEISLARDSDPDVPNWYDVLIPMAKGTPNGGKQQPTGIKGGIKTASVNAERDAAKFDVIQKLFEITSFPNDGYYQIRWGACDAIEMVKIPGGYTYVNLAGTENTVRGKEGNDLWLYNWGKLIAVQGKDNILTGDTTRPGRKEEVTVELQSKYEAAEFFPTDNQLLALDVDATTETNRVLAEFEINYILGNDMDYDAFVQRWLNAGGQQLINEAKEQFKEYGLIK